MIWLRRVNRDDGGFALILAVSIAFIAILLSTVIFALAQHNILNGALDRATVQGQGGAEAGLDEVNMALQSDTPGSLPCGADAVTQNLSNGESFAVSVYYYSAATPSAGTAIACQSGGGLAQQPVSAILLSTGTTPKANGVTQNETMEEQVGLVAQYQPFQDAVYSNQTLNNQSTLTVDSTGTSGSVYTNGDWDCTKKDQIEGNVEAQGNVLLEGGCHVSGWVWGDKTIATTTSDSVGGYAKSSTSCVWLGATMTAAGPPPPGQAAAPPSPPTCPSTVSGSTAGSSTIVGGSVTAGTICTYGSGTCASPEVGGRVYQNVSSPPPPAQNFPTVAYNQGAWQSAGYTIDPFNPTSSNNNNPCPAAEAAIDAGFSGPTTVVVNADCPLIWSSSGPGLPSGPGSSTGSCTSTSGGPGPGGGGYGIAINQGLAIITNGPIFLDHDVKFCSTTSQTAKLFLVVPDTTANAAACVYGQNPGSPPPSAWDSLSGTGTSTESSNPDGNTNDYTGTTNGYVGTNSGYASWNNQDYVTSPDLDSEDNTTFQNVQTMEYTPCSIDMEDPSMTGQVYAGNFVLENNFTLTYQSVLIPGNGIDTGNQVNIAYLRQVAPNPHP